MFGVDSTELIILAVAALIFIGPKDLPLAMRAVGRWVGQVRGMARHFHTGVEAMIREAELEEMEKKWSEENERIMREYPALTDENGEPIAPPPVASGELPTAHAGDAPGKPPPETELP